MRVQEIIPVGGTGQPRLDEYLSAPWRFFAPTCTTEVVTGTEAAGIHLNRPVPGDVLKRLTYHREGMRPVKHATEDGHLAHP